MFALFALFGAAGRAREEKIPSLEKENSPTFIYENFPISKANNLEGKSEVDTTISGRYSDSKKLFDFIGSSILISSNALFSNCFDFSTSFSASSGGALFVTKCGLQIESGVTFSKNSAGSGGAILAISSSLYINGGSSPVIFQDNTAFRCAGAIFFQAKHEKMFYSSISNAQFKGNTASDNGGAIFFTRTTSSFFEGCHFIQNEAGLSGGAIYSKNTELFLQNCAFVCNKAGESSARYPLINNDSSETSDALTFKIVNPGFLPRGGGAIYFLFDPETEYSDEASTNPQEKTLYTSNTCFYYNNAKYATNFKSSPGNEIMFSGRIKWQSFEDTMNGDFDLAVGARDQKQISNIIDIQDVYQYQIFGLNKHDVCDSFTSYPQAQTNSATFYSRIEVEDELSGSITDIPKPTTFIYQATMITELPYKTSSSWSKYSFAKTFSSPPTLFTVQNTYAASPFETPFSSPFSTPFSTPNSSPFESPFETPFSTPFSTPNWSPFESPYETPFSTPFSSPNWSPFESPYETPFSTPFNTPHTTPIPTQTIPVNVDYTHSRTFIDVTISFDTVSVSTSTTVIHTMSNGVETSYVNAITFHFSSVYYTVSQSETLTYILFLEDLAEEGEAGMNSSTIIIIVSVVAVVVFVTAVIVAYIIKKRKADDFSESSTSSSHVFDDDVYLTLNDKKSLYIVKKDNEIPITQFITQYPSTANGEEEYATSYGDEDLPINQHTSSSYFNGSNIDSFDEEFDGAINF